jgi:hypothetical protein
MLDYRLKLGLQQMHFAQYMTKAGSRLPFTPLARVTKIPAAIFKIPARRHGDEVFSADV